MKHFIIAAEIYLAGGCFWGTEHFLKQIRGVESTEVGYANSIINQPTYQQVCSGETNAAETVKVVYDPETVNLSLLLDLYFKTIDPTSLNRQGNDRGTQYRTGIYYTNKADIAIINQAVRALADQYKNPIAIEVKPLTNFYPAENYHQDYLDKNPGGYCHINLALFEMARKANAPKTATYQNPDDATLRKKLSAEQYAETQKKATEPAYYTEESPAKESSTETTESETVDIREEILTERYSDTERIIAEAEEAAFKEAETNEENTKETV